MWGSACSKLSETLSKDIYDRWISVIRPLSIKDNTLYLQVANDFYHCWLEEHYLPLIREAIQDISGEETGIQFKVDNESCLSLPETVPQKKVKKSSPRPVEYKVKLNPKYTFEHFIVGPSNHFAHAAAMAVAQNPARAYNPLFIYGGVGLGKTHLMQAIGRHVHKHSPGDICYISSEEFINKYIRALQRHKLVEFRKRFRNIDVLLIDDIQFLGGKERMQEEFFHTFNALHDNHKQIVLTCDRPASEIPSLTERLVSRFEWGQVTELEKPDIETRLAILQNKAEELSVSLPDPVFQFIAEHIRSNIRRLEGALIRVASYTSLTQQALAQEKLENLLNDLLDQEQHTSVTMEDIKKRVAEYFDIRLSDMTSKRRPKSIALPRQVAMYLCRTLTSHSLPDIGECFNKNHATVLHACRTIESQIVSDRSLRQSVQNLEQKLSL